MMHAVKCARCGKMMPPNTPEEEAKAQAEYEKYFPNAAKLNEPRSPVCDKCYSLCHPEKFPKERAISETFPELN